MRAFDNQDLIAAIATPRGNAGVGIVRISGQDSEVQALAKEILAVVPLARNASYLPFYDHKKKNHR